MTAVSYLSKPDGSKLAYSQYSGSSPGIVFLGGFKSDMHGTKAVALEQHCIQRGIGYLRFDYSGHGHSDGEFIDGTIGQWLDDTEFALEQLCTDRQLLVGSSMGGWLMLLTALCQPDKIAGLVGIACAADFTERLIWQRLSEQQQADFRHHKIFERPSAYQEAPYEIAYSLIEEGRNHLLLDNPIAIDCPVRLLHGLDDIDVPWSVSTAVLENLTGDDASLQLIKNGDHRLSSEGQLKMIFNTIDQLHQTLSDH